MEETIDALETDTEFQEMDYPLAEMPAAPMSPPINFDAVPAVRRSHRLLTQDLKLQAESLTRKADEIEAAAQKGMGIALASRTQTISQKIEEFYGVRQVPEGLLFVAHFPNAHSVAIAGDFNNWNPDRMVSDSHDGEAADTFRTLVNLKPGRYRYRLVVDGRWQADPHNVYAEPNPFGELDSIVEVV